MLWQWQATMHLNGKGYKATLEGDNRDDATSGDATVRDEYVRKNGDLFREILRMLNAKSEAGKTLMLQIQDEFDNDHDGYGLWEYLKAWASSLTPAEVKVLKKRVEALKFSASETPGFAKCPPRVLRAAQPRTQPRTRTYAVYPPLRLTALAKF